MHPTDSIRICNLCGECALCTPPRKPHRKMGLHRIYASAYMASLERHYECSVCKTIWRRRTDASGRSEEHTSELQSLMRISYAVFCLTKKHKHTQSQTKQIQ